MYSSTSGSDWMVRFCAASIPVMLCTPAIAEACSSCASGVEGRAAYGAATFAMLVAPFLLVGLLCFALRGAFGAAPQCPSGPEDPT